MVINNAGQELFIIKVAGLFHQARITTIHNIK
jgi:hypothetical protein